MRRALAVTACLLACLGVAAALLAPAGPRPAADGVLAASGGPLVEVAQTTTTTSVPLPPTSTTLAPSTTRVPPTTAAPRSTAPARPPGTVAPTSSFAPPPFPTATLPPGADPEGLYGFGASKTVTNGPDTLTVHVYPYDLSVDSFLQLSMEMTFAGGVKSVRYDFGDGTSEVHDNGGTRPWWCEPPFSAVKASSDGAPYHSYAHAGTYPVTVTLTTVDCQGAVVLPAGVLPPDLAGAPPTNRTAPIGQERVTTVTIGIVQRADRYPLPRGPAPGP
ncbi:MAG TPA: hypothetical protein VL337_17505 [Acidimicrobiales bacterium]|jgi:hypothetical protein|nr:hypothetical protein [Acidimicrobiales bacterium]